MKTLILSSAILILSSCASMSRCPTEQQQPISTCRAEVACGKGSFGHSLGMILGGAGSGLSGQRNQAADNYHQCVIRELDAQKYNVSNREIASEQ